MKRNIFILGALCLLYACSTSEIIKYGERPRINFENTSKLNITVQHYVYFTDEDFRVALHCTPPLLKKAIH